MDRTKLTTKIATGLSDIDLIRMDRQLDPQHILNW